MLRVITRTADPGKMVIEVHGSIAEDDVAVLTSAVEAERVGRHLILDLHGVRFADQAGVDLLRRWTAEEMQMRGGSLYLLALLRP